jgi:CDGSH-type Zn-finger protein
MKVEILENGPIILEFESPVSVNIGGATEEKTGPVALCRCGKSSKQPFCDGKHREANFKAPSAKISVP